VLCSTNIKSETLIELLLQQVIPAHGLPDHIQSDNGPNYRSINMKKACEFLAIKHTFTTPYHAMGNGLVENFNKTLEVGLSLLAKEHFGN
jgi:transposase InsO family protein